MSRWFRFYDDAVNDPKIIKLSDDIFRAWVNLLCVASKHDGALPAVDDIAIILRVKASRAATIIAELVSFGLLDRTETGFAPHNWSGRQYKSDVSNDRVKQHRERKRNVTSTVTVTPPDTDTETVTKDRIVDAGASRFTKGSKELTDAFLDALGFDTPLKVPLEFAGISWRAVTWETAGWTADLIAADAKRIGPDKPLTYYEKVFATSFAKRHAPLPVVEVKDAEQLTVTRHGTQKNESLSHVARRHAAAGIAFGERPTTPSLCIIEGGADVRLLPQGGGERPGDLRSGDGGGPERIPAGGG